MVSAVARSFIASLLVFVGVVSLRASEPVSTRRVLLLPVQDRAGDPATARLIEGILRREFSLRGFVIGADQARSAARRNRLRRVDTADPEIVRALSRSLEADWIVTATVHEATREQVPRLTVSVRILDAETAGFLWARFGARSGMDGLNLLGVGVVYELERLAEILLPEMLEDLPAEGVFAPPVDSELATLAARLGRVAVIPFAGLARFEPTRSAETVAEATRVAAHRLGVELIPGNLTSRALRQGTIVWGEVDQETRENLRQAAGADTIVTGSVEAYEGGGGELPRPRVTISIRLVDARTGRLLWAGGEERGGWDRQSVFELGRVYSGGRLSKEVTESLLEQLLRQTNERLSG